MSKRLDDAEFDLLSRLTLNSDGYDYLRSASLKYRYAKRRLVSLRTKITRYKGRVEVRYAIIGFPDPSTIEMDLDHCIACLRSSIEHLAQLINSVANLGLKPVGYGKDIVSPYNVVNAINASPKLGKDPNLSKLSSFLQDEMQRGWYKELNTFRIEMYHYKSKGILDHAFASPSLDPDWMDKLFVVPADVAVSAKTRWDREVCSFCQNRTDDIENVLHSSFSLLSKYLS